MKSPVFRTSLVVSRCVRSGFLHSPKDARFVGSRPSSARLVGIGLHLETQPPCGLPDKVSRVWCLFRSFLACTLPWGAPRETGCRALILVLPEPADSFVSLVLGVAVNAVVRRRFRRVSEVLQERTNDLHLHQRHVGDHSTVRAFSGFSMNSTTSFDWLDRHELKFVLACMPLIFCVKRPMNGVIRRLACKYTLGYSCFFIGSRFFVLFWSGCSTVGDAQ